MSKSQKRYNEGKRIHRKENHDGSYATCDEWTCIAYKARARHEKHGLVPPPKRGRHE